MNKVLPKFSYPSQLEMLQKAVKIICQNVGISPISFRGGRFGANMDTLRALGFCGFKVDCSVTPFVDWGFPATDLLPFKIFPYFIRAGSRDILEIPVTIVRPFSLFPAWLRPSLLSGPDMINVIKIRAKSREDPLVLNMMFHSMELIDPNPYLTSKEFFRNIRCVLEYAYEQNVCFITMNDLYHRLRPLIFSDKKGM